MNQQTFSLRPGLHCKICSTFTPHVMYWKYFDKCFMGKNLLLISLTKFNKLNKRKKRTFLTTQFKNKQNIKTWFLISKILFHGQSSIFSFYFSEYHRFNFGGSSDLHLFNPFMISASIMKGLTKRVLTWSQNNPFWLVFVE